MQEGWISWIAGVEQFTQNWTFQTCTCRGQIENLILAGQALADVFFFILKIRVVEKYCVELCRINDKKLASILTKSNLPSEGLFYKLGSYHQLPGSILPNPSPAEVYYPTLVQANGHHPSPVLSISPSAHCAPELAKAFWNWNIAL